MKFFVVSYTNRVKRYCEKEFIERFNEISQGHQSLIIDNTPGREYFEHLSQITPYVAHIDVPELPVESLFQRNVTDSVNLCRNAFLQSDCDVMVTIESDVIPPVNLIELFENDIIHLQQFAGKEWGILGGLYYNSFHDYSLTGLQETHHVLSGCTAYSRKLLEKFPFRYNPQDLGPFPDAIMSFDAGKEFSLWNDHEIYCKHLEVSPGCRQSA